jgi:hypothetical protein
LICDGDDSSQTATVACGLKRRLVFHRRLV